MAKFRFLALQEIARRKPVECGERPRCSVVLEKTCFQWIKCVTIFPSKPIKSWKRQCQKDWQSIEGWLIKWLPR